VPLSLSSRPSVEPTIIVLAPLAGAGPMDHQLTGPRPDRTLFQSISTRFGLDNDLALGVFP